MTELLDDRWPVARCDSANCGAEIVWALTGKAKRMPVDAAVNAQGNIVLRDTGGPVPLAVVLTAERAFGRTDLHLPHWATCPDASSFRRRRP